MKINVELFTLAIIFLSISCSNSNNQLAFLQDLQEQNHSSSREFLESFLKTVIGSDTTLNEDCLGGKYDDYSEQFTKAILNKDLVAIVFFLNKIFYLENEQCPIQDLKMIFTDFHSSWNSGNTWINIMKHSEFMKEKIQDFVLKSSKSPKDLGLFAGVIFKALVYGFTQL